MKRMNLLVRAAALVIAVGSSQVMAQSSGQSSGQSSSLSSGPSTGAPPEVEAGQKRAGWSFREAGLIPVQSNGRIKPLDSFARDAVLFETGSRSFDGWDPVDLLFSWITSPREWENKPFIQVTRKDVKRQLGLDENRSRFSPREIYQDSFLAQYAAGLERGTKNQSVPIATTSKPDPRDQELKRLLERVGFYRALVSGEGWPVVPTQPPAQWATLAQADGALPNDEAGREIRQKYAAMLTAYLSKNKMLFNDTVPELRRTVLAQVKSEEPSLETSLKVETLYNRYHPFMIAWIFYLLGAILWTTVRLVTPQSGKQFRKAAMAVTILGGLSHTIGFFMRCYVAGRPPVTNMYESIIWVSLGVMAFAAILYVKHRQAVLFAAACSLATLGLIAADAAPAMMDPGIHPLVPVLRSNYWLTVHVLTITLGYAAFALTLGIGNVTLFQYMKKGVSSEAVQIKISGLNHLTYRAMQFGVALLAAGTILGGIWADYSWGRFWGWDPKEVWALIALLGYLAVLHARYTGWMRQFGFAAWTVISFSLVVMAWYGVNFVLGVGLHSYGFSSGGQGWVAMGVILQLAYVGLAAYFHFRRDASGTPVAST